VVVRTSHVWPPEPSGKDAPCDEGTADIRPRLTHAGCAINQVCVLTLLYSWAGLGIAIVNDFKSVEGDRAMGLQSLPVAFGVEAAKWICVASIDVTQALVAAYLAYNGQLGYAGALVALILPQMYFQQKYFLVDPVEYDVKYQASAQPFLVLGILVTALAVGHADYLP